METFLQAEEKWETWRYLQRWSADIIPNSEKTPSPQYDQKLEYLLLLIPLNAIWSPAIAIKEEKGMA